MAHNDEGCHETQAGVVLRGPQDERTEGASGKGRAIADGASKVATPSAVAEWLATTKGVTRRRPESSFEGLRTSGREGLSVKGSVYRRRGVEVATPSAVAKWLDDGGWCHETQAEVIVTLSGIAEWLAKTDRRS
jgi:hypothetical protein